MLTEHAMPLIANDFTDIAVLQFRTLDEESAESVQQFTEPSSGFQISNESVLEQIREETRRQAFFEAEQEIEKKDIEVRSRIVRTLESFAQERKRYFEGIEQQVVRLSLAIAEKVLHREATIDPLLLTGAVRVALDNVAGRSPAVLRVPATEAETWQAHLQESTDPPELRPDETMREGECVLETKVGTVDLGIRAQLAEIEASFLDLLGRRPMAEA
ncbi:MAG: hypothetical protein JSS87_13550 [Acidobacteria bacterium]|nr:hypothetical protein [Acidobacteriota bacterium]